MGCARRQNAIELRYSRGLDLSVISLHLEHEGGKEEAVADKLDQVPIVRHVRPQTVLDPQQHGRPAATHKRSVSRKRIAGRTGTTSLSSAEAESSSAPLRMKIRHMVSPTARRWLSRAALTLGCCA